MLEKKKCKVFLKLSESNTSRDGAEELYIKHIKEDFSA